MFSKHQSTPPWFWLGVVGIWGIALGLRFWGLERFNTLVFDEVYFAKFAHHYLTHTPFFDAHPPLGKYLIAIGIWLKGYTPWGYRWMNALFGSVIPLLMVGLGLQLTRRPSVALLAGALTLLDGLLLVESRYGLINVYLLAFGLLGQWLLLVSSGQKGWQHWGTLCLAGLSFGATAAVKWTGLGFLLSLYLFWGLGRLSRWGRSRSTPARSLPLVNFLNLSPWKLFIVVPVVGTVLYSLLWIPHLLQNPEFNFIEVHQQMYGYHRRVGSGPDIHPYCSSLLSWPLMLRPVSYFYQLAMSLKESVPVTGPPQTFQTARYVYSVYAIGNPPLWWATTGAIALVFIAWGRSLLRRNAWAYIQRLWEHRPEDWLVPLYLVIGYGANLLPWLSISRCAFLYHYMPAYLVSSLALAWVLERWLKESAAPWRQVALVIIALSLLGFLFWLPLYLGLPLSPREWQWRIWLPSWI